MSRECDEKGGRGIPKFGDFSISLESVVDLHRLDNQLTILKLGLGVLVLVVGDDVFLCVLDTRAVDAEGCGDAWDCGGFHCSVLISEEEEGKGDAEEVHNNNNNIQRERREPF